MNQTLTQIEEDFDEKVNELNNPLFEDNVDGYVAEFGYKTTRKVDGYTEVFTVTDFGNIKKFLTQSNLRVLKKVKEMVDKIDNPYTKDSPQWRGYETARSNFLSTLIEQK